MSQLCRSYGHRPPTASFSRSDDRPFGAPQPLAAEAVRRDHEAR